MKIILDPKAGFITDDKKFDKRNALISAGVKAAVCFRDGDVTPGMIRATETDEQLLKRGLNTILSDHTSPSEQQNVSLEIVGIPKILCMILNNEHQYTADERSLRYTEVKPSDYITLEESTAYDKWLNIFIDILVNRYYDFFRMFNHARTEELTAKKTYSAIKKIAQENARYLVSVFMPTTLTYTVPLAQINKICVYMQRIIDEPQNEFEELLVPDLKEFIKQLRELDVVVTEHDAFIYAPTLKTPDTDKFLYKNNKDLNLSLFSERRKFSGINQPNEYGVNVNYNINISFASLAQFQRHRTISFEMQTPSQLETNCYIPLLIKGNKELEQEWLHDVAQLNRYYPQGKLVKVNVKGSLEYLVNYVGKERACDRAFLETEDVFTNQMLPDIYEGLLKEGKLELAEELKPYIGKLRCMYPDYKCPAPCGHPRVRRLF